MANDRTGVAHAKAHCSFQIYAIGRLASIWPNLRSATAFISVATTGNACGRFGAIFELARDRSSDGSRAQSHSDEVGCQLGLQD